MFSFSVFLFFFLFFRCDSTHTQKKLISSAQTNTWRVFEGGENKKRKSTSKTKPTKKKSLSPTEAEEEEEEEKRLFSSLSCKLAMAPAIRCVPQQQQDDNPSEING